MNRNEIAYDLWAKHYDEQIPPHAALEAPHMIELVSPQPGERILDLACGTGRMAKIWRAAGARVTGVDVSVEMLEIARRKIPDGVFVRADLNEALPFAADSFDKITSSLAIKHLANLETAFSEAFRVCASGGAFALSTIHPQMDWSTYERKAPSSIDVNADGENHPYGVATIVGAATAARWRVSQTREVYADASIEGALSPASFRRQLGTPYVWALALRKAP